MFFNRTVTDALYKQNTDFFDASFQRSDELKHATHGEEGYSLLHFAVRYCSERMVVYFLDRGFSVYSRTFYNQTALHVAVIYCKYGAVKLLIERGSPINARDSMGRTALHCAMEAGTMCHISSENSNVSNALLDLVIFNTYVPRLKNKTFLFYCTERRSEGDFSSANNRDIISHLLSCGAEVNASTEEEDTPLFQAIARGSPSWLQYFLERGANLKQCKQDYNALHYAAWMSDNKKLVELLLDAGIEVNSATEDLKQTALHLAASSAKNVEIVNLLIERGANIHAKDGNGDTPIFWAIGSAISYEYINELEVVFNDPEEECSSYYLYDEPQKVQRRHQIICSLLNAGVDVNDTSDEGVMAFHRALNTGLNSLIEPFLERGVNVRSKTPQGLSVLHAAVKFASETVLETLIDKGASMDDKIPYFGVTPLHLATQLCNEKHIMLLLAKGANVNVTDNKGCTPLHYIAYVVNQYPLEAYCLVEKIIGILLDNGADFFARTIEDKTTLDYAVAIDNDQAIEPLLRHLAYLEAMGDPRALELVTRVIGNNDELMQIYEKYQLELFSMKEEKIYADVHYIDTITLDLKIWVRNDEFVEAFKNNQTIKKFYFYEKVSKKFDYALRARDASECIALLFNHIGLPIEVCEMIVEYFKLEDLKKMQGGQVLIG
ncbi:serine/threonine-protein phosphatase 6 regulatory ankyrin repeat subunit A-like [Nasonia vitripennis]|uniref:Ankyrin repeat protein n=1 Tax=Nasonia vitripennis TaxID=7425 RepID=A0A7M7H1F8_NASVI|nr:serine/threonine-protein phosphatase 6 regulatory ankyrin repeat subunit A-like [Nasonia vitripennis]